MRNAVISRIPILPGGLVNAHLIHGSQGAILVDAGLPGTERRIDSALRRLGLSFRDIKLIVITHAHVDHAGGTAKLRDLTGAPVAAHVADLPYYRREKAMTFCPTGWFGRLFLRSGLMYEPYAAFEPDILLQADEALDLHRFGVDGVVRHTGGHTAGSLAVELGSRDMLVGDLISSGLLLGGIALTDRPKRPPFEDDPAVVSAVLQRMVLAGGQRFHMGHGGPLDAGDVERHLRKLSRRGALQESALPLR
ncbi:MBL fold metallo-hydrolase [Chitinimonas arctica]|uniref:MBL fold metallo-hydrolase n=1 Tax=Chitinimonas arctica TaxID=2594795 RepID=UPI001CC68936|nr:MBL fold metallo-hydrolase [Chitinimonas arctica]